MNEKKKIVVGIDLGTTFSSVSHFREGKPEIIPDQASSDNTIPSAVFFPEKGKPIVGKSALSFEAMDPDRLVQWIKRNMGEDYRKRIGDEEYTPEQVSAEILKYLKRNAETYLGAEVNQAIITVPAYFGDRERAATIKAGGLAGLEVMQLLPEPGEELRLLSEPIAAAFAYALEGKIEPGKRNILVYDLGGGTFDVTLLQAVYQKEEGNAIKLEAKVLAKDGSRELGGRDWDKDLIDYLAGKAEEEFGLDLLKNLHSEAMLRDRATEAKHQLSDHEQTPVVVDNEGNTIVMERQTFEEITKARLYQTEEMLNHVMEEAESKHGVTWKNIDTILLVGGSTRMPMVRSMLERVMADKGVNIPLELHRQVELTVSMGAAYFAQMLSEGEVVIPPDDLGELPIIVHVDFVDTVKAIGVLADERQPDGTFKRINVNIIPDGSDTDTEFTVEGLRTRDDNQTRVQFQITEGDSEIPDEVQVLGEVVLTGLPANRPAGMPLKVLLTYNKNGIITGEGIDVKTGQKVDISIDRKAIDSAA